MSGSSSACKSRKGAVEKQTQRKRHQRETIAVDVDGDTVVLDAAFTQAVLKVSVLRAARVHARFVQRVDRERLAGFKSYFFRETDRHTMYYVRGRLHMLHAMRKKRPSSPMSEDVGVLSADEAEAVVFSTFVYRLYNRLDTVVRWALLRRHVADAGHDPDTEAEPGRWAEALEQLTEEELDEVHCAQRCWSPCRGGRRVEPRAVRAVAVQPGQLSGFFACVEALRRRGIKVFTGQHQVQGSERTRAALESLLEQGGDGRTVLSRLTRDLRDLPAAEAAGGASVAARACALLGAVPAVGPFLQYQLLLDLIEPRHSIFRGTGAPAEAGIAAGRFEYAQFGNGSLGGAGLVACGKAGAFKGAAGQQEARRVARALVRYGGGGEGGGEAAPLGPEWAESLEGLCPLPEGVASHLPGGAAVGWDMQAVENVLCGIHGKKTPAAIVASAANEGKPWAPNPCTDCEYDDLYGGVG